MRDRCMIRGLRLLTVLCLVALAPLAQSADTGGGAQAQARRQASQPYNNAPFWRDVRRGENPYQTTQVRGVETNVLIQSDGQLWREIRNGPVTRYGGWLLVVVAALIAVYYVLMGPLKLREKPTGRLVERFTAWERMIHWSTAISFLILAVTGLITLFGKHVVLPVFGYTLFSWLAMLSKNLHNFVGPVFALCTIALFVTFAKDNLPKAYDWIWVKKLGGFLGSRDHVPSGRFNFGEKSWFWLCVTLLGIVMAVTGFIMDFPNFDQGRSVMQLANIVHAIGAALFVAFSLGHIYVGTIGVEGAYDTMRTGMTDETWAKEHHEYWYDQVKAAERPAGSAARAGAVASSLKEGWKL